MEDDDEDDSEKENDDEEETLDVTLAVAAELDNSR
jgi:hypothetical protein